MSRQLKLMPSVAIRRQATYEAISLWSKVLVVVLVVGGGVIGLETWRGQRARQIRNALEAQHTPIKQLRADIRLLKARIAGLTETRKLALELASDRSVVTLLGHISQAAAYAGGDLFLESLGMIRRPATADEPLVHVLQLEGSARDNLSVTRFAEGLRQAGIFQNVQLTSTGAAVLASQSVTAFDLECTF